MISTEEFIRTVQVASYEIGPGNVLKLSVLLRMAQETSEQHLEALNLGYERLSRDGMAFLITTNRVRIRRMPKHGDVLTIKTHPRGTAGVQFYRDFVFYLGEEETASVMQASVCADVNTHKLLRPKSFLSYGIFKDESVEPAERVEKFRLPEDLPCVGERPIRYSDLDQNCHLNNTIYGDIFMDFLPGGAQGREFREIQINYVNESTLGETLKVYAGECEGALLMHGDNERGLGFSVRAYEK